MFTANCAGFAKKPGSANQPPVAAFSFVATGLSVAFTDASTDPDGSIASWAWAFGDGATSTLTNPSHTYGADGTYTTTLTVTDNLGATDSLSQSVSVVSGDGGNPDGTTDQPGMVDV